MNLHEMRGLKKGARLVMTNVGMRQGLQGRATNRYGRFVGLTRNGYFMTVRRTGIKSPNTYSPVFWAKAP